MPKALCMTGIVISILVFVLFLFDLVGPESLAPLKRASPTMDIVFIISALALGVLSWLTLREQD